MYPASIFLLSFNLGFPLPVICYKTNETAHSSLVGQGLKAIVYLVDGIVAANGEQAAIQENAAQTQLRECWFHVKHRQEQMRIMLYYKSD